MTYIYLPVLAGKFSTMNRLYIPNFCQYFFDFLEKKGRKFLFDRLERTDFLKVRNDTHIRSFAENSSLDDKMIMAAKTGMGCAVVLWDKEKQKTNKVQDVLIAYADKPAHELPNLLAKDKVYACVDLAFIQALQTISKASNSYSYTVSSRFLEIRKNSTSTRNLVKKLEADQNLVWFVKNIAFALNLEPVLEVFNISLDQFRILLYLHGLPNGATKENIMRELDRANITGMLQRMDEMNMVTFLLENKSVVSIDVYGVMVLERIFAKFP